MNPISLLKLASSVLGIGPQAAMRAAEQLYLSGFVSYPRTESTAYPAVRMQECAPCVEDMSLRLCVFLRVSLCV